MSPEKSWEELLDDYEPDGTWWAYDEEPYVAEGEDPEALLAQESKGKADEIEAILAKANAKIVKPEPLDPMHPSGPLADLKTTGKASLFPDEVIIASMGVNDLAQPKAPKPWDDPDADPMADLLAMKKAAMKHLHYKPHKAEMSQEAYDALKAKVESASYPSMMPADSQPVIESAFGMDIVVNPNLSPGEVHVIPKNPPGITVYGDGHAHPPKFNPDEYYGKHAVFDEGDWEWDVTPANDKVLKSNPGKPPTIDGHAIESFEVNSGEPLKYVLDNGAEVTGNPQDGLYYTKGPDPVPAPFDGPEDPWGPEPMIYQSAYKKPSASAGTHAGSGAFDIGPYVKDVKVVYEADPNDPDGHWVHDEATGQSVWKAYKGSVKGPKPAGVIYDEAPMFAGDPIASLPKDYKPTISFTSNVDVKTMQMLTGYSAGTQAFAGYKDALKKAEVAFKQMQAANAPCICDEEALIAPGCARHDPTGDAGRY